MNELRDKVIEYNRITKEALQTVYDALNKGQRQKLIKNETVKKLFERYKIKTEDEDEK